MLRQVFTVREYRHKHWCRMWARTAAILVVAFAYSPPAKAQCDSLKPGTTMWVRLLQPVSSYSSKAGDKLPAMVIESPACAGMEAIAAGTVVEGEIKSVQRVGMGLVHETANIRVDFDRLLTKDGKEVEILARVVEIDNARETVKNGLIRGVNATDTPQGRISNRLRHLPTWNPYADLTWVAYRAAIPIFPEPEIYLPRGADMRLELMAEVHVADGMRGLVQAGVPDQKERATMEITTPSLPQRTTTPNGRPADFVNVALVGTAEQMDQAFHAAGWNRGDPTTTRSVMREMHALMAFKNYPEAPISKQL